MYKGLNNWREITKKSCQIEALALSPLRLSNKDHDFLMDAASLLEGLNYVVEVPKRGPDNGSNDDEEEYFGEM